MSCILHCFNKTKIDPRMKNSQSKNFPHCLFSQKKKINIRNDEDKQIIPQI